MLTGGVGYSYDLGSTTPAGPLTQTNVPGYPLSADGKKQGGLTIPPTNVWKVATGFTGRRAIVEAARCDNCHAKLGVAPTFHVGQRNDGPSCSFCHTPNRTSSAWSAGSKYFIHALHGGRARSEDFVARHRARPRIRRDRVPDQAERLPDLPLTEHVRLHGFGVGKRPPELEVTTVGTGRTQHLDNRARSHLRPARHGLRFRFSFNAGTGVTTEAAGTTLVITPITTICSGCRRRGGHLHMEQNGGAFCEARANVSPAEEQCMLCHGPGKVAAIGEVHVP
jgi:OmcA/MtrC family decaheme c-type cytochrome